MILSEAMTLIVMKAILARLEITELYERWNGVEFVNDGSGGCLATGEGSTETIFKAPGGNRTHDAGWML